MLVQEFERNLLRGDENAGNDLVLEELRRTIRAETRAVPRIGDAARLFFAPIEPFLIDAPADHRRIGRIARVSIETIWGWFGRDLIPAETKTLGDDINRALVDGDETRAVQMVRALQERAVQRIGDLLAGIGSDEKPRRRLNVQVGTPRAVEDLSTIFAILSLRDMLADLGRRLPSHIRAFERDQIDPIKTLVDTAATQCSLETGAVGKSDVYLYGLILVMHRLVVPWQLVRTATRAADSDDTARIAETPYAVAVTIVLGETEGVVSELRTELKCGRPIASLLKGLHDAVRGLRTELDLSVDSPWSRQLAAIRADVSGLLKAEIEATPGCVRRLLRPRPAKEIAPGSLLDSLDVSEAENRVAYVGASRQYASELAINEVATRAHSELTLYLETATKVLLDTLRHAGDPDRPFRQSQVDAAIRFCRIVFGAEYAGLLAKAAEVAVQSLAGDRKPARA